MKRVGYLCDPGSAIYIIAGTVYFLLSLVEALIPETCLKITFSFHFNCVVYISFYIPARRSFA